MVRLLSDMCLTIIQSSLDKIPDTGSLLPTVYKERLIERLSWHDGCYKPSYLPHIAKHLFTPSIRKVNFYKCDQITDKVLELIGSSCCRLEEVSVNRCNNVTDVGLTCITRNQTDLTYISLKKLKGVTDKGLKFIESTQLKSLDLTDCSNITFEGVYKVAQRNPSIICLKLSGIEERNNKNVQNQKQVTAKYNDFMKLISCLEISLEELDTQLNQINDDCLMAVANMCPNLKKLNIHGCSRLSGDAIIKLSMGCTNLEELDLSYCSKLSTLPDIQALWTLPQSLTHISLCGIFINDGTILVECLQRLRHLKSAKLSGISTLNDITLTQILTHLGGTLTSLDICACFSEDLTEKGIKAIADHCSQLDSLALSLLKVSCSELLPLFKDVSRAVKFKKLALSVKALNKDVLYEVARSCTGLQYMDVSGLMFVNDDILRTLSTTCHHLSHLSLKGCREVTDAGVCSLAQYCPLVMIVLSGIHKLTDKSVFALANSCHYLEEIYISGCAHISPAAVRYLVDCSIPRLFVKHATPNAPPNQLMARNLDTGEFCVVNSSSDQLTRCSPDVT